MKTTPNPGLVVTVNGVRRDPFVRCLKLAPRASAAASSPSLTRSYLALGWMQANELYFTEADVLRMTEMMLAAMKEEDAVTRAVLAPHGQRRGGGRAVLS